ncbi:glutamate ligase domain-containing protein [Rubrivirga sp.]|uniref:glutamate ligase domain-containing protein n=1 Tax=Rubrivirga sp. TaxID=1885344 RepID=UPI003B5191CC
MAHHPALSAPLDSRRQTGAGFLLDGPGAALEALVPEAQCDAAADAWRRHARTLCDALGWTDAPLAVRRFPRGLSVALGAPVDRLYTAAEVNEAAWERARAEVEGRDLPDLEATVARLRDEAEREADPPLAALIAAAESRGVPLVWDDDAITVGLGSRGQTFAPDALPAPDALDWDAVGPVPTALVTGTNGKSTTVRMLAGMARAGGHTVGFSTTDAVTVGDEVVERGDFSGPLGARAVMRDARVTLAICESARGGLLRRGVPVPLVTAAALTNVAADHLGDYGVETVPDLADAKLVVAKALGPGGVLVAPADEPQATAAALRQHDALRARGVRVAWTALDPATEPGPLAASVVDGAISLGTDGTWRPICPVADVPAALGGAARHVVRNALTASALARALGLSDDAIAAGLRAFRSDETDNPGRANRFDVGGARVVVDYAHNAHGLRALADLAAHWPARRRLVLFGSAGDRSDDDLAAMADVLASLDADRYVLVDIPGYLRGRDRGEVPALLTDLLRQRGIDADACVTLADPVEGTRWALDWAEPDDLAVLLALSQRDQVLAMVRDAAGR